MFDEDGYLTIVDRKKELIINAAGKNMSPANIEAALKSASPLIGQACCIGDRRPYNTALIVLDADFAPAWAAQQGIEETSLESLAHDERVRAAVQEGVDAANATLARPEQVKKFTIVEGDWLPGGDELTPTMKLKRKPIAEKYADEIDALYAGLARDGRGIGARRPRRLRASPGLLLHPAAQAEHGDDRRRRHDRGHHIQHRARGVGEVEAHEVGNRGDAAAAALRLGELDASACARAARRAPARSATW